MCWRQARVYLNHQKYVRSIKIGLRKSVDFNQEFAFKSVGFKWSPLCFYSQHFH